MHRISNQDGSVLATVLLVLVVLLTVFLSAMTYALARYGWHVGEKYTLIASHLSDAGIQHWLHEADLENQGPDTSGWQPPNGGSVTLESIAWGPCLMLRSEGGFGAKQVTSYALLGSGQCDQFRAALTVGDETVPLVVAGHSRIIGDVNTGSQGVMPGRIRGEAAPDEGFLEGSLNLRPVVDLPRLDTVVLATYMRGMTTRKRAPDRRCGGTVELGPKDGDFLRRGDCVWIENNLVVAGAEVRYFGQMQSAFCSRSIEIGSGSKLSGLIELVAEGTIRICDSSTVDACLLWARDSIIIEDHARFSGIAITPGTLIVRECATLAYPALLFADRPVAPGTSADGIRLCSKGRMETTCMLRHDPAPNASPTRMLYVDTGTAVCGFLWSEDRIELRGRLIGSAVTEQFQYTLTPSVYVNWLRDTYVNRRGLDFIPALPAMTAGDSFAPRVIRVDRGS